MDNNNIDYNLIFKEVNNKLESELSKWRYNHTISVMKLSIELAKYYGVDEVKIKIAALFHDYAKEYSKEKMLQIVDYYNIKIDYSYFGLYHGVVARHIAEKEYGIVDESILSAIEHHTLSKVNSTPLDKILLVADTADISRDEEGLDEIREIFFDDLNKVFLACIKHKLNYNLSKGKEIVPVVYEIIDEIEKEIKNETD